MWTFLIILLVSTYINCAEDKIVEIEIATYTNNGELQCMGNNTLLQHDQKFRIYINFPDNLYRLSCFKSNYPDELKLDKFWKEKRENGRVGYLSESTITVLGNLNYSCQFYLNNCNKRYMNVCYFSNNRYEDNGVKCSFNIQTPRKEEMDKKPSAHLSLNNEQNFSSSGEYHPYYFYDGEAVNFKCYKDRGLYIQISYTSKAGTIVQTNFQETTSLEMYMKLTTAENDYTNLVCTVIDSQMKQDNVTMLLIAHARDKRVVGFEVNGLILPLINQTGNTDYYYKYKYYPEEKLYVAVLKDDQIHGDVNCGVDGKNIPYNLTKYFNGITKVITEPIPVTLYEGQTETSIACTVPLLQNQYQPQHVTITFINKTPDYEPFISGLSTANILMKYSNATDNIIHYDYKGDEYLYLRCTLSSLAVQTSWNYSHEAIKILSEPNYIEIRPFKFEPNQNSVTIKCYIGERGPYSRVVTDLVLIRRNKVEVEMPATPPLQVNTGPGHAAEPNPGKGKGTSQRPPEINEGETTQGPSKGNPEGADHQPSHKGNVETTLPRPPLENVKSGDKPPRMDSSNTAQQKPTGKPLSPPTKPTNKPTAKKPASHYKNKSNGKKLPWRSTKKTTTRKPAPPTKEPTKPPTQKPTASPSQNSTESPTKNSTVPRTQKLSKPESENNVDIASKSTDAPLTHLHEAIVHAVDALDSTGVHASPPTEKKDNNFGIMSAAAAVILVVIAVVIWILVDLTKRKRRLTNNQTDIDYQNLPMHNEGPMATPAQWEAHAKAATTTTPGAGNLETLYSKPLPKNRRNTKSIEPTYAEACDAKTTEHTYASVLNEPPYATVQNGYGANSAPVQNGCGANSAPVQNGCGATSAPVQGIQETGYQNLEELQKIKQKNELMYAEVDTTTSSNKPVPPKKPIYSEIGLNTQPMQKYVNVQDIKRQFSKVTRQEYANVSSQKEIEPAYCQLKLKTSKQD